MRGNTPAASERGNSSDSTANRPTTDRAQSSNLGLVLLLALTITGAGVVVAVGSGALADVQEQTSIDRAENAMTLLDARTAVVGLGEGSVQRIRLGRSGGEYAVESDRGWLRIRHDNYTAGETEELYNASLGAVTYRSGDAEIAYQGGGVWRHSDGGTAMVSPPEFHYRGTTLTLPVLRVRSTDAASGDVTATVRQSGEMTRVFPNESQSYAESSDRYLNPITNGTASVTVHSRYYEGWAEYFRTRTTGNVSVDDANRTATVVLETTDPRGSFPFPQEGDSVAVRGMADGHSVTDFETSIRMGGDDGEGRGGSSNNLYISFNAVEDDRAYEVIVELPSGIGGYCNRNPDDETLRMEVYYGDESTDEGVHYWTNDSIPAASGPVRLTCEDDDPVLDIDFTSSTQNLTYQSVSFNEDTEIDWNKRNESATEKPDPITFSHSGDDDDGSTEYGYGDEQNLRILTRHYFAMLGPEFDLRVTHGPGDSGTARIDRTDSGGVLRYDRVDGGSYITYLHVTENNVSVELD
jgi:hypothetical protein